MYMISSFYIKNKSLRKKNFFPKKNQKIKFFTEGQNIFKNIIFHYFKVYHEIF